MPLNDQGHPYGKRDGTEDEGDDHPRPHIVVFHLRLLVGLVSIDSVSHHADWYGWSSRVQTCRPLSGSARIPLMCVAEPVKLPGVDLLAPICPPGRRCESA